MLEKDALNFLERTPYQYINIRRDWSGKGVNGEVGSDETTVLRTRYQGKCRKFGTDSLGGQYRWFTSPRKTQKTMDGRHKEWSGCSCIQLKEMSQDRDQWSRAISVLRLILVLVFILF